jgi:hypothetical protein
MRRFCTRKEIPEIRRLGSRLKRALFVRSARNRRKRRRRRRRRRRTGGGGGASVIGDDRVIRRLRFFSRVRAARGR